VFSSKGYSIFNISLNILCPNNCKSIIQLNFVLYSQVFYNYTNLATNLIVLQTKPITRLVYGYGYTLGYPGKLPLDTIQPILAGSDIYR
jgi:hypothetical protein